jgi:hypothetical protein
LAYGAIVALLLGYRAATVTASSRRNSGYRRAQRLEP